jgi:hypothetical protein
MRKLTLLVAIVALVTLTLALPAVARDNAASDKWENASSTGENHWAQITENPDTKTGWCVSTHGKGPVPAVC